MRLLMIGLLVLTGACGYAQESDLEQAVEQATGQTEEAVTQQITAEEVLPQSKAVVVCPITGVIDEGIAVVVQRAVDEATALNAEAIIFRIDTPGGRVDSAVKIATAIGKAPCKTIAYIEGLGGVSAGAMISFSCDELVMTTGTIIGASEPVIPSAQGNMRTGEKEHSVVRAIMRSLAESNGHNPDIAEAMVDTDIELWGYYDEDGNYIIYSPEPSSAEREAHVPPEPPGGDSAPFQELFRTFGPEPQGGWDQSEESDEKEKPRTVASGTLINSESAKLILPNNKLLTLTSSEALDWGVIEAKFNTFQESLQFYDLADAEQHVVEANWAEKTFGFLTSPTISGLLLMLAMGGLYLEVKTPGFGAPGIIGGVCLVLLFGSHYVLGLTDVIDIVLVLSGVTLLLLEIFVFPGFGIAGAAGIICLVAGTYLSLVDVVIPEFSWQFAIAGDALYSLAVAMVSFAVFVLITWFVLPRTPFYSAIVLSDSQQVADGYVVRRDANKLGLEGIATSMLRPAGRGRFGNETLDVVSRGDFIDNGARIVIIEVQGNRYVVDPFTEPADNEESGGQA